MCMVSALFGPTLWKCGSIVVTGAADPTVSVCAPTAGAVRAMAPASAARAIMDIGLVSRGSCRKG